MMNFSPFLLLILLLTGCQAINSFTVGKYVPPTKPGGRMCIHQCRKALDSCGQGCKLSYRACYISMQSQALKDYESYTREQFRTRQPTDLWPSDFERRDKCKSPVCRDSCTSPYNLCYEKCGGKVVGEPDPVSRAF